MQWLRGGTTPEAEYTRFEVSTDHGATWTPLGTGTRIAGGWELPGLELPARGHLRARARTVGAFGVVETIAAYPLTPEITVQQPVGTRLLAGLATVPFGYATTGGSGVAKTFTIANPGAVPLTISSVSVIAGASADFTVNTAGMLPTVPALIGQTTFTVTFHPTTLGPRTATLRIASNDPNATAFDVSITGTGLTAYQMWKLIQLGNLNAPDTADPDADGIPHILEFAFNLPPLIADVTHVALGTGLRGLPSIQIENVVGLGERLTIEYIRHRTYGTYTIETSADLAIWTEITPIPLAPPVNVSPDYERLAVADIVNVGPFTRFLRVVFRAP